MSILIDAIDGTTNFRAALPFFCSAVAFFIKGRLCIGAIYDPLHHEVFYGSIRDARRKRTWTAKVWKIQTGTVLDLKDQGVDRETPNLIATHITRSNPKKRDQMMTILPKLCGLKTSNGIYLLNSGQMALGYVAAGNLMAFVNNTTKIWDVAAGEVLVRAVGGKVTNFKGERIDYGSSTEIDVIASRTVSVHKTIFNEIQEVLKLTRR